MRSMVPFRKTNTERSRRRRFLSNKQLSFLGKPHTPASITSAIDQELDANPASRCRDLCDLGTTVVNSPMFEMCFGFLILINCLVMAFEAQYSGIENGHLA